MVDDELRALAAEVARAPEEDGPRLAFAKALEVRGEVARATLIRKQCEFAEMPATAPGRAAAWSEIRELLQAHGAQWLGALKGVARLDAFWRGFLQAISGTLEELLVSAEALAGEPAISHLQITGDEYEAEWSPEGLARFGELAFLRRLRSIELDDGFPVAVAAQLLKLPGLSAVRSFTVRDGAGYPAHAAALAAAIPPSLRELSLVGFMGTDFGDDAAMAFAASPALARLERLRLWNCNLRADGAAALASSPHLAQLRALWLGLGQYTRNRIGAAGCRALVALRELEVLDLDFNEVTDDGWLPFVDSGGASRLRELRLQACSLTDAGVVPMLARGAPELVTLDLSHNQLGVQTCRALAAASLPSLRRLWLYANPIGPQGLAELLAAPWLGQLEELNLESTGLDGDAVLHLARAPASAGIQQVACEVQPSKLSQALLGELRVALGERSWRPNVTNLRAG